MSLDALAPKLTAAKLREQNAAAECKRLAEFVHDASSQLQEWRKTTFSNSRVSTSINLPTHETSINMSNWPTVQQIEDAFSEWKQAAIELQLIQQQWQSEMPR